MPTNQYLTHVTPFLVKATIALTCLLLTGLICLSASSASTMNQDDPPKEKPLTIKDVMEQAHKQGLTKKVATGKATEEETKKLHTLYKSLAKLSPPKGDKKSWDDKTKALVEAAKAAVDKDANFATKLKNASNCATCHKLHKP